MAFLRPDARLVLWRWRETLVGISIVALGVWVGIGSLGLIKWFGVAVATLGAALAFAGYQRARFRVGFGGAGVVHLDERQITYFGPIQGGTVVLDAMVQLELGRSADGETQWSLSQYGQPALLIPANAEGAEALFDAFSVLDGLNTEQMLSALAAPPLHPVVIWRKQVFRLH